MTTGSAWLPGRTTSSLRPSATWSSSGSLTPNPCSIGKRISHRTHARRRLLLDNGAPYSLDVRPSTDAPIYATFAELFKVNFASTTNSTNAMYGGLACATQQMADWWTQKDKDTGTGGSAWKPGQMTGYADSAEGYPSNMQPALAMAAESGHAGAMDAWNVFIMRPVKPDYSTEAQFAIVPRTAAK